MQKSCHSTSFKCVQNRFEMNETKGCYDTLMPCTSIRIFMKDLKTKSKIKWKEKC